MSAYAPSSSLSGLLLSLPWSVDDTARELMRSGIAKDDCRLLQSQDVDGESIALLTDEALARMGVPTFGRRAKILRTVQAMLEAEAKRKGMRAPNILGVGAAPAAATAATAATAAQRDPYGRGAGAGANLNASGSLSGSSRFDAGFSADIGYDDGNLLDPAALTPAASANGKSSNNRFSRNDRDSSDADSFPPTRDFGVSQPLNRSSSRATFDGPGRDDRFDVDRDRLAEEDAQNAAEAEGYDSDVERQFVHPRLSSHTAAFDPSAASAQHDPYGSQMAVRPWQGAIVPPSRLGGINAFNPEPPTRRLQLEWVHGYRAFDSRSNLFYNAQGDICYPVAGLCVVYRPQLRSQKFFFGMDDDVRCLAQHPRDLNLVASGQNGGIKEGHVSAPRICVWDSSSSDLSRSYTLQCTQSDKAIRCLGFSGGEGKYLASVSSDAHHSLKIWDWRKRLLLTAAKSDTNPIFFVKGNPRDESEFVTVGKNHVLFWRFDGHVLKNKRAIFAGGAAAASSSSAKEDSLSPQSFYSIAFSEKGYACLGSESGAIYVFVNGKVAKTFSGIHRGKILSLEWYRGGFVSGGSDGKVHVLDKKMDVVKSFQFSNKVTSVHIGACAASSSAGATGGARSGAGGDALLVGTQGSDVFELRDFFDLELEGGDESLDAITRGHSDGELHGLAVAGDGKHFVTVGEDNTLCLWSNLNHKLLKRGIISERKGHVLPAADSRVAGAQSRPTASTHPVNQCARSVAISPTGSEIVVGSNEGELIVFDTRTFARKLGVDLGKFKKDLRRSAVDGRTQRAATPGHNAREHWINCISFSPSGHAIAVGTQGSVVVLLDVTAGYAVKAVLDRSSAPITSLDWSVDGTLLCTNDANLDLLFYHVDEQNLSAVSTVSNASSVRDVAWATRSTTLSWPASGITEAHHQGRFVNTADANASRTLIASGDDSGQVKLFRYPALPGATPLVYSGHSAHVTCVRFTADERFLITTGGFDLACMVWRVV